MTEPDTLREAVLALAAKWEATTVVGSVDAKGVCKYHARVLREVAERWSKP